MKEFEELASIDELKEFLSSTVRMNGTKYVYHYTNIAAYKGIVKRLWYFSNPKSMNDRFEYSKFSSRFDNMFFACFQSGTSENLGMWSMYAQPWSQGVIIGMKASYFKKWIESITYCYEADKATKKKINKTKIPVTAKFAKIIYTKGDTNILNHSGDSNNSIIPVGKTAYDYKDLAGFVKDTAWEYEKEFRIKIDVATGSHYDGIIVEMPEPEPGDILLIQGPKFANPDAKYKKSLFYKRLGWVACDTCKYKISESSFRKLESYCNKKGIDISEGIKEAIDGYVI